jgi:hypothetical protein
MSSHKQGLWVAASAGTLNGLKTWALAPEPLLAQKRPRVIEAATTLFGDSRRWEMFLRFSPAGPDKIQSVPEVT